MWLIVGLGNPGSRYEGTRHNVGFRTVDALRERNGAGPLRAKMGAELGEADIGGRGRDAEQVRALLCKPMEMMNVSGQAVTRVARFWKIAPAETVVAHDDLDLPFGRLKLDAGGGGHGGHNGLRSLIASLGSADFLRVRVGIGRPAPGRQDPADYVLSDFSRAEQAELPDLCARAAEAVETIVLSGLTAAMNRFNARNQSSSSKRDKKEGPDA